MKKLVGVWGLGITGVSAIEYFLKKGHSVWAMDASEEKRLWAEKRKIDVLSESELDFFLTQSDLLFVSGGIDVTMHYATYAEKWIHELDIFQAEWRSRYPNAPIVAISGTIGKTTVTHLLSQLLAKGSGNWLVGGNIGIPILDLLESGPNKPAGVIIEVSSFQLNYSKTFSPDVAILTNIYPNHLDRHKTMAAYIHAKLNLFKKQTDTATAIFPLSLKDSYAKELGAAHKYFFSAQKPSFEFLQNWKREDGELFFLHNNCVMRYLADEESCFISLFDLSMITFDTNWMIIALGIHVLGLDPKNLFANFGSSLAIPDHRVEYIGSHKDLFFYNDSKSTVPEATIAAIERLKKKHPLIVLFLGGESKGIDRSVVIQQLTSSVEYIYCFGKEADMLHAACVKNGIPASSYPTLDAAFSHCVTHVRPKSCVLFSPAGSSYDLFKNYQERGNYFKKLMRQFMSQ